MKIEIKKIMAILNIKSNDVEQGVIVIDEIENKLKILPDKFLNSFVKYCEQNFNKQDLQYLTGYQKFLELFNRFQKGLMSKLISPKIDEIESYAKGLIEKVQNCEAQVSKYVLKGIKLNYEHFRYNGVEVFSKEDRELLYELFGDLSQSLDYIFKYGKHEAIEKIVSKLKPKIIYEVKLQLGQVKPKPPQISTKGVKGRELPNMANLVKKF